MRKKVRQHLDESTDEKLTDEMIDEALNDKQRDIAHQRLWSFFEIERSLSRVANQFAYDIPATVQKAHNVRIDTQPLIPINKSRWDLLHFDTDTSSADPSHVAIWNSQFLIYPRPSASAQTTALDGQITAAATTITVDSTSGFHRGDYYRFIIDSEVIYATTLTSTTFTGCVRGREGTTAATHANDATVTERDIVYDGHVEPTDLIDTQDRTPIPEPDVLTFGAAADLAPFVNKENLVANLTAKYEGKMKQLEGKFSTKQTSHFGRVKSANEVIQDTTDLLDPNLFPKDISTL